MRARTLPIGVALAIHLASAARVAAAESGAGAQAPPERLGLLHGKRGWEPSVRKLAEAAASPAVVAPGLGGSRRAALFWLGREEDAGGNTGAQHRFGPVSGRGVTVRLTVRPSNDARGFAIAVRDGARAAAYLRLSASQPGLLEHYDHQNRYHAVGHFSPGREIRLQIVFDTTALTVRTWIDGVGGQPLPFHAKAEALDVLDVFMTHGRGTATEAVVDDISVSDGTGRTVFEEDFEDLLLRPGDKPRGRGRGDGRAGSWGFVPAAAAAARPGQRDLLLDRRGGDGLRRGAVRSGHGVRARSSLTGCGLLRGP